MTRIRFGVLTPVVVKERRYPKDEAMSAGIATARRTNKLTLQLAALTEAQEEIQGLADLLRQTAAELDVGTIHRCHAANRLRKIANEIANEK